MTTFWNPLSGVTFFIVLLDLGGVDEPAIGSNGMEGIGSNELESGWNGLEGPGKGPGWNGLEGPGKGPGWKAWRDPARGLVVLQERWEEYWVPAPCVQVPFQLPE